MDGVNVAAIKYNVKDLFGTGPDDPGRVRENREVEVVASGKRIAVIVSADRYEELTKGADG